MSEWDGNTERRKEPICKYDGECKSKFDAIATQTQATCTALQEIRAIVDDTHKRLFVGNGEPAVMIRIDRVEQIARVLMWAVGIAGSTVIVALVGLILTHLGGRT